MGFYDPLQPRTSAVTGRWQRLSVLIVFVALSIGNLVNAHGGQQHEHAQFLPFSVGDQVEVECLLTSPNGTTVYVDQFGNNLWGPSPPCADTGLPLSFRFGQESEFVCRWVIDDDMYILLRNLLLTKGTYQCRIPLSKDKAFYMPVPMNLWGGVEPAHIHIMNHMNFVFHSSEGFFLGATAYPLRDNFQLVAPGYSLTLHGPVSWFEGHRFDPLHLSSVPTPSIQASPPPPEADSSGEGSHQDRMEKQILSKAMAKLAEQNGEGDTAPTAKPIAPEIPLNPRPTRAELSERACVQEYGFVPGGWVTTYCLASGVGGGILALVLFRGFWLTEGLVEQRKQK
ncbi:hypothetical protein M427DRAFT_51431 [Gonapodya prolifera JEL478]|uniref:Uncharacterized protein n=1 Tax=Gonapodya prolifera (strain JEL478) TaxID=1344416 RepID=A0A139AWQ0_GONPJ|nr:hypothetical protein M427DRAFT_51431 [Gonapodya prolifera JEL478]|eukprot:KXS21166.1 hypothetical protein M427DRAFT_51431 [Gonapodya prolifera JEL478]